MIYVANYFFVEVVSRKKASDRLLLAFLPFGLLYGGASWEYAYSVLILLALFVVVRGMVSRRRLQPVQFLAVLLFLTLVTGACVANRGDGFSIQNAQDREWLEVQKWAKENTARHDLFVVPPNLEGFRVESERAVYCEWKDGTVMFVSPRSGYEWFERLTTLGYTRQKSLGKDFKKLVEGDFVSVADRMRHHHSKTFVVMFSDRKRLDFPVRHSNEEFVVYEVQK